MKITIFLLSLLLPVLSQAIECVAVNTYVASNSDADYNWKPFNESSTNDAKFYNASVADKNCSFSISNNAANGDTYYVSISNGTHALSGLVAFDAKGHLQFSSSDSHESTVCMMKCTK